MSDLLAGLRLVDRILVAQEAIRLLATLPDCPEKTEAEVIRAVMLPERGVVGTRKLQKGTHPLAAMLLGRPASSLPRVEERDWLRGWALVGCLRFCHMHGESDRHSRCVAGLRTVRRMATGHHSLDLLPELPTLDGSLRDMIRAIRDLVRLMVQRGSSRTVQLGHLDLILTDARHPTPPRDMQRSKRESGASDGGDEPPEMVRPRQQLVAGGVTTLRTGDGDMPADSPPEELQEELRDRFHDFALAYRRLPPAMARAEAQLELLEREAEEVAFQTSYAALTPLEGREVFAAALRDGLAGDPGAGLVLATLVTGRSVAGLALMGCEPCAGTSWQLPLGGIGFAPDVRFMANPVAGGFGMYPPAQVSHWISRVSSVEEAEARARSWLARQDHDRDLRLSRIERALHDALIAHGEDPALAALLCGHGCAETIQLHYARFSVQRLQTAWKRVLTDRYGCPEGVDFRLGALAPRRKAIGSLVSPSQKTLVAWFQGLVAAVHEARGRRAEGVEHLVDRVAAEANLAAAVLCFETARRPHRGAFEPLSQITGRRRRRVRLEGKGGRQVDDGRWVPLGAAGCHAIDMWLGCLSALEASWLPRVNPDLARRIVEVRAGTAPLFFGWTGIEALPEDLSAADLHERIGSPDMAPDKARSGGGMAPANWARHYMRGAMAERGLPGTLIDAWLGHGGAVADPMAPASGFAAADQDQLRAAIDALWQSLEIELPTVEVLP